MYLGSWAIDNVVTFVCNTHVAATGAATDADSPPTYRVFEDETTTPILTGTMALLDSSNTSGFYSEQITLSAANGFEKGKSYSIYISATVSTIVGTLSHTFQMEAEVDANVVSDKTGYGLADSADDAILAAIAALNNLSAAQVNAEVDTAIVDAALATAAALSTAQAAITLIKAMTDTIPASPAAVGSAMTLVTDALSALAVSAAAGAKLADIARRRTQANVEASSDGDALDLSSQYGAIQMQQEAAVSGVTLTVKKTDGTTTLGTKTLTVDVAADPVVGVA